MPPPRPLALLSATRARAHEPSAPPRRHRPDGFFAQQILAALAYCHEMGVAHRDVKPENVLVEEGAVADGPARLHVTLVDWGSAACLARPAGARRCTSELTRTFLPHEPTS